MRFFVVSFAGSPVATFTARCANTARLLILRQYPGATSLVELCKDGRVRQLSIANTPALLAG